MHSDVVSPIKTPNVSLDYRSEYSHLSTKNTRSVLLKWHLFYLVVPFVFVQCSPEQDQSIMGPASSSTANDSTPYNENASGTDSNENIQSNTAKLSCEPRDNVQVCYCLDGQLNGTQRCDADGRLWPCEGCPKTGANEEGALCPELITQVGCEAESHSSDKLPASILFVVDRSGSMRCNTPADGQSSEQCELDGRRLYEDKPSKWEVTVEALREVLAVLENSEARAGLMFFSNDNFCGVHSDLTLGGVPIDLVTPAHVGLITSALQNQSPEGGTPLVGATILAYAHIHQEAGGSCSHQPCGASGNRFIVLITDGSDSCPDPVFENGSAPCGSGGLSCTDYLLREVPKALNVNISTFVIGAPGSELSRGFLSELAFQGGTAQSGCDHSDPFGQQGNCHYDMTSTQNFAADLGQALLEISGTALGCEFSVPPLPDGNPDNVNVQYTLPNATPVCIQRERDNSISCDQGAQGWQFAKNPDGSLNLSKVVLCGEYCEIVKNNPGIQVDILLGCTALIVE